MNKEAGAERGGEFLPSYTISFYDDGRIYIGDERVDNKYPGFRFVHQSSTEISFVKTDDPDEEIIWVLSKDMKAVGSDSKLFLKTNRIAVLAGDEARIYRKLRWQNPWRHHPAVGLGLFFQCLMVYAVLVAIHIALSLYFLPIENFWYRFWYKLLLGASGSLLLPLFEIFGFFALSNLFKWSRMVISVYGLVKRMKRETGKHSLYYHILFVTLSAAQDPDIAGSARTMAKFF